MGTAQASRRACVDNTGNATADMNDACNIAQGYANVAARNLAKRLADTPQF